MAIQAERARPQDLTAVLDLLRACDLPVQGVTEQFGHYFVVREEGRVVGAGGLEVHGEYGLLRSAAVAPESRRQGAGAALVGAILGLADRLELKDVFLLTTTARPYFERQGFAACPREEAPGEIRSSWEFTTGCPTSAAFMKRRRS